MPHRILLVDDDEMLRKMTSKVLAHHGFMVDVAESGQAALQKLETSRPDLILLDVMMPGMDGYAVCRKIRERSDWPYIPVIMLTALDSVENKVKGFEAGADDYLVKPFNTPELIARIQVQIARTASLAAPAAQTQTELARTIAVYALRGGAGVSTIAANLAVGLGKLWEQPVALVDMVRYAGQTALFLNQPLKNTWGDLAHIPPEEMDEEAVQAALLSHESGVYTLAAPRRPEQGELLTPEHVGKVLDILRQRFSYVVLDLPHDLSEHTLAALDRADVILLILQPEIVSIRAGSMALEIFDSLGYGKKRIYTIINWVFPRNGLPIEDIQRFTKRKVDLVIPYATDEFIKALNLGQPVVLSDPDAPLCILFEDLAMALSKESQRRKKPENPSETWQRVVQRIRQRKEARNA
jgi:pilus assembly protein CpaE